HAFKLLHKGIYSAETRSLARFLVHAGCSQESVGRVINKIARLAGATSNRVMSRHSVSRALIEGGVASRIQLGFEIKNTNGNNDGTTHKNINYESRFIELKAP
ncbi:hypothetical protein EV702DRAFT_923276, partial [Suillus placidus]